MGGYWESVHAKGLTVPTDRPLDELTAELTRMLGDPDPEIRDGIAFPTLATWIERGVYDDWLPGLGDGMSSGLAVGLGEVGTETVFRRSYSALVLGVCIGRDNERPLVPGGKVLEWGDRVATWLLRERDLRAYVPGQGWAHAVAHACDVLATLGSSPHLATPELTVLLDVIADRVVADTDHLFTHGEPDHLAGATLSVLRRNRVPLNVLEPWVRRIVSAARPDRRRAGTDPFRVRGNAEAFLRSLYLQLAFAAHPPQVRSDLLLVVVDALRETNPDYLHGA